MCIFFSNALETDEHVFFSGESIWKLWGLIFQWWNIQVVIHSNVLINIEAWSSLVKGGFKKEIWTMVFFCNDLVYLV